MSLIVCLHPYPDESLQGFLRRVSESNFAPGVAALLASFGMKAKFSYSESEIARLASQLGIDEKELSIRQPGSGALAALQMKYQRRKGGVVCPLCIADGPYHRVGWNHLLVTACPHHNTLLVSNCKACGRDIEVNGPLDRCACGQHFALAPIMPAGDELLALSAFLMEVEHPARQSLPPAWATGMAPPDAADLLCLLGRHLAEQSIDRGPSTTSKGKTSNDELIVRARAGIGLLLQWPTRFDAALSTRLASTEGPGLAKRLGGWYRELHHRYKAPAYECLRIALVQHLSANFDGHLNLRLTTIDATFLQDKNWLSVSEAGRLIGMGSELIRSAVITGEIKGKITEKGRNRFVSIHKAVVEQVRKDRQAYLDATATRKQLGVSKALFERLIQAGALRKQTKRERPPVVSGEFLASDVSALVARLKNGISGRPVQDDLGIGLHDISVRRGISNDRICAVLHKILALEIRAVAFNSSMHGLAGLRFDLAEIQGEVIEPQQEPTLSITELVNLRGWKHESILQWIKQGALRVTPDTKDSGQPVRVPLSALLDFMSEYAVLADLANRTGSKSPHLLRGLMPAQVKPVGINASGTVQRGVLIRVDDLLLAAQWNKRPKRLNSLEGEAGG
jgi:hypothetical protein